MNEKMFEFAVFGSLLSNDNIVLDNKYFRFVFNCMAKSWKEALNKAYNYAFCFYIPFNCPDNCFVLLGVSHYSYILCNNKLVNFNYVNKVIREDDFLKEHFWY